MTKEKIMEAAKKLFATKGYDSTSISDVLKKTGLSKGALYYHFTSKEELFLQTVQHAFECEHVLFDCDASKIKSKKEFKKALIDMGNWIINSQKENPQLASLQWEVVSQMRKNPALRKSAQRIKDAKMQKVNLLIQKGIVLDVFPKDMSIDNILLRYFFPLKTIGFHIMLGEVDYDYQTYWKEIVEAL